MNLSFRKKIEHIWYYYKVHICLSAFLIYLLCTLIVHFATARELGFCAMLIDSQQPKNHEAYVAAFAAAAEIDQSEYDVVLQTTVSWSAMDDYADMKTGMYLQTRMIAGDLDVTILPAERLMTYRNAYSDLRTILPLELLTSLGDAVCYSDDTEPIPIGLSIADCDGFMTQYYYPGSDYILVIPKTCPHPQYAEAFVRFVFAQ